MLWQITKLRAQNTQLASLLEEERRISAQLKTDMIAQLTALLTNHSLAQTQRLETVLGGARDANQKSIDELTKVTTFYDEDVRFAASEADKYCEGIEVAKGNNETGRQSSSQVGGFFSFSSRQVIVWLTRILSLFGTRSCPMLIQSSRAHLMHTWKLLKAITGNRRLP